MTALLVLAGMVAVLATLLYGSHGVVDRLVDGSVEAALAPRDDWMAVADVVQGRGDWVECETLWALPEVER